MLWSRRVIPLRAIRAASHWASAPLWRRARRATIPSGFPAGQIGGIMGAMPERQASRGLVNCAGAGAVATKTALPLMFA